MDRLEENTLLNESLDDLYDLTIIGGGPVGQFAAYYSGLRGMRTKVIDSLPELGGQLAALYPEKYIYDVAGFPKVYAKDLVNNLTEQMMQYNPTVCLNEKVMSLVTNGVVKMVGDSGTVHLSKSVLITAGVGAFTPRKLDVEGIAELEGKGVYYFVKNKAALAGKRILIVGAGDSAFDWALNLHETAESITMIHRTDRFRAMEDSVVKALELPIQMHTFHEVKCLHGGDCLTGVTIFNNKTKEEKHVECDVVLFSLGYLTNLGPIKDWGLDIVGNSITVNSHMETNIPRVYAAGDVVTYDGKLKLIATGFGEATTAVCYAKAFVDPTSKVFPGHSSESVPEKK